MIPWILVFFCSPLSYVVGAWRQKYDFLDGITVDSDLQQFGLQWWKHGRYERKETEK
jgi:hypothetical protein